ncbi:hypothetical protein SEA_CHERRYONLIM_3 [Gordonia phage CherryonLim]|uniref:Uncharacterized protein n=1 Tax=Gordonia phage CherryonLim TaxID=2652411 RepID=A0A5P8D9T2_9CAUD|nr:hypothetical protein PP994_gp03 [Gordonia phage CherryonLim]QFP95756.1 hypothetical protein SEA_CHERRYONLIM_3 [Gordonia phage CherryonLim]
MTIVNRVPLLHKPLPVDASLADVVEHWGKRMPLVDWFQIASDTIHSTGRVLGFDRESLSVILDECYDDLSNRRRQN